MSWRDDVSPAQAGDAGALERLREFLTPFVHGVALAWAPHHVVERLMPRLLDEVARALPGAEAAAAGAVALATARRLAKEAGRAGLDEAPHPDAALRDARQALSRLRAVPDGAREWLLLRLLEGVPGPEAADVANAAPAEVRAELERGAAEAARALGQAQSFAGDGYLWELLGAPSPLLAQLEMLLPALRYDPSAPSPAVNHTAGTLQDLAPVGAPPRVSAAPVRGLLFDEHDETAVGAPPAGGSVMTVPERAPVAAAPNPFEPVVRTIAASDLPAEARGQLPAPVAPIPSGSSPGQKGPRAPPAPIPSGSNPGVAGLRVPPRGDGSAAAGNESSGRSGRSGAGREGEASSKSGRMAPLAPRADGNGETSSKSGRMAPLAPRGEGSAEGSGKTRSPAPLGTAAEPDATRMQVPALVLKRQEDVVTTPEAHEGILNAPTMTMAAAIASGETRLNAIPAGLPTRADTALATPEPRLLSAQLLQGSSPWLVALALLVGGLLANWAGIFTIEKRSRLNWNLTQVVVAAEEMSAGSLITVDNVALRAVPSMGEKSDVVKGDALAWVLDQKLAVDVQAGDPLFYSQFVANRGNQRLSQRVAKMMRGFTIPTTALTSVAHHVKPGDLVDVVTSFQVQGQEAERLKRAKRDRSLQRSVTILQAVSVLATGRIADFTPGAAVDENEKPYSHVTLLLTAEEAELVTLARTVGPLTLTLRNDEDRDQFAQREYTDIDTLLDGNRRRLANQRQRALVDQVKAIRATPAPK